MKLLAIHHNPGKLQALQTLLSERAPGVDLFSTLEVSRGLELARAEAPDVILLDLAAPELDANAVCRTLMEDGCLRETPVLFLTGAGRDTRPEALEAGAEGSCVEPLDDVELVAQIRAMARVSCANRRIRLANSHLAELVAERTRSLEAELRKRERVEADLRASEERFRVLFENAPLGYQSLDDKGNFLEVNETWCKTLGYTKQEVLGRNFAEFIAPDFRRVFAENFPRFRSLGQTLGVEFEMIRKDGSKVAVSFDGKIGSNPDGSFRQTHCVFHEVTGRRRAEMALRSSERNLRSLFDAISESVCLFEPDGRVITVNETFAARLGRCVEDCVGRNIFSLIPPEVAEARRARVKAVLQSGRPTSFEDERQGRRLRHHVFPVLDADGAVERIVIYAMDISDQKRAEEALRLQSRVLNQIQDRVAVTDLQGVISHVNEAACASLKRGREELVGQSIAIFGDDPAQGATQRRILEQTLAEGAWRGEVVNYASDGQEVILDCRTRLVHDPEGRAIAMCGIATDITERKRAETALRRYAEQLEEMVAARADQIREMERQRAENEKLAATGRMAARIAHEINNPLGGIKNAFLLIKDTVPADHPYFHYVRRIEEEIQRIARIIAQMFDLYRPETEGGREFVLHDLLDDLAAMISAEYRGHQIPIEVVPGRLPARVTLQEGPLRQVLYNLLTNGIEASRPGGTVRIGAEEDGNLLTITVADQGSGIPEALRPQVFEPFFTTKEGRERKNLGLGLSIAKNLVETMGGSLGFTSVPGQGTVFRIVLPLRQPGP